MQNNNNGLPWILISLSGVVYALSCKSVLSLFQMQEITPMPKSPPAIRGVINFRGQIIQLVDINNILGLKSPKSIVDEFTLMMDARLEDHLNWINVLEKSVVEGTEITVQVDPHLCAFGKWYDSYDKDSSNIMFLMAFAKFDVPHKAIHATAIKVKELLGHNDKEGALQLIESIKNTEMKQMIQLFSDIKEAFKDSKRQIAMVLGDNDRSLSLAVDEITAIEHLTEIDGDLIQESMTTSEFILGTGKRKDGSVVLLLNEEALLDTFLNRSVLTS